LPDVKRERLIRAALAEVAAHDYEAVNLDRISEAARVAKGSLYQYFDRQADLYAFAVLDALERAGALFRAHLAKARPGDALEAFGDALSFAVELRTREPVLAQIYWRVGLAGRAPEWLAPAVLAAIRRHNEAFRGLFLAGSAPTPGGAGRQRSRKPAGRRRAASASDAQAIPFILDAVATRFHMRVLGDDHQYGLDRARAPELRAFAQALASGLQHVLTPREPPLARPRARRVSARPKRRPSP
jgi:AcrR family transcriptional regulator